MAIIKNLQPTSAIEGVEEREMSCTVCGTVNWQSHCGKWYGHSSKKLKTAISIPGYIYKQKL